MTNASYGKAYERHLLYISRKLAPQQYQKYLCHGKQASLMAGEGATASRSLAQKLAPPYIRACARAAARASACAYQA